MIVNNITVFYFLIKVSGPLQGGEWGGNDDDGLNHFRPWPTNSKGGGVFCSHLQRVEILRPLNL